MAWALTYPAAKAAIIALWDAAVDAPIINGPRVGGGFDMVGVVGYQDENNPLAVEGEVLRETFGAASPERDQYAINCMAAINWGSTSVIPDAEAAVCGLVNALGGALAANRTLGVPGVMSASIGRWQLPEAQGTDGLTVALKFSVTIDAFTTV